MKSISIIIPCYNSKFENLLELLQSFEGSLDDSDQVVWVNDGSSDSSGFRDIKKRLKNDPKHFFTESKKNLGTAAAINRGIKNSNESSYIITIAHDDKVHSGYLSEVRNIFKNNPLIDIIVPNISQFGEKSGTIKSGLKNKLNIFSLFKENRIFASSAFRFRVWEKLNGFDEALQNSYEDWDFWFRASLEGFRFFKLNEIGYYYRIHHKNSSKAINHQKAKKTLWRKWRVLLLKHFLMSPYKFILNFRIKIS